MSTPTVGTARGLAKRHGLARCVVWFMTEEGRHGYASYGKDRATCDDTKVLADRLFRAAEQHFMYRMIPDSEDE